MNNKLYIIIPLLIFVIVGELIGITIAQIKHPPETSTTVLGISEQETLPEPVKKYCENYYLGSDKVFQTPEKPRAVLKCEKNYKVEPPASIQNSPVKMINKNGEVMAICRVMSFDASIESFEQKECEESCDFENLCSNK